MMVQSLGHLVTLERLKGLGTSRLHDYILTEGVLFHCSWLTAASSGTGSLHSGVTHGLMECSLVSLGRVLVNMPLRKLVQSS